MSKSKDQPQINADDTDQNGIIREIVTGRILGSYCVKSDLPFEYLRFTCSQRRLRLILEGKRPRYEALVEHENPHQLHILATPPLSRYCSFVTTSRDGLHHRRRNVLW